MGASLTDGCRPRPPFTRSKHVRAAWRSQNCHKIVAHTVGSCAPPGNRTIPEGGHLTRSRQSRLAIVALIACLVTGLTAGTAGGATGSPTGAGSTLIAPLETFWKEDFKSKCGNEVTY